MPREKDNGVNPIKANLDRFRTLSNLTTAELYGTEEKFHEENERDFSDIKQVIKAVTNGYKKTTGEDVIEFFNSVSFNDANRRSKSQRFEESKKNLLNLQQKLENPDMFNIGEIFSQETNRFQLYNTYRTIYENIPQLSQALKTYVDNILSPDDFTKNIFNILIKGVPITSSDSDFIKSNSEVIENCKKLIETYKLEDNSYRILTEALKVGDQFVAVLNYSDELNKMVLNESDGVMTQDEVKFVFNESNVDISDEEVSLFSSFLNEEHTISKPVLESKQEYFNKHKGESTNKLSESYSLLEKEYNAKLSEYTDFKTKVQKDIADVLNNNLLVSEDSSILLETTKQYEHEFAGVDIGTTKSTYENNQAGMFFNNTAKRGRKQQGVKVGGSIIKLLEPERTIKISLNDKCFGYYYADCLEQDPDFLTTGAYSVNSNIFTNFKNQQNDKPELINTKYRLISDVFVKNISKKINKKFINKHPEFKETIYTLVKNDYITKKQTRIVYLKPSEVVHFGEGTDEYKDSIFKTIMFMAKLYLAVLTSQVMLRLVRSPEKRAFYIETDLDNDTEAVVQSFIRDTKTKDIKMTTFGNDINTIMNAVGTFQDYFIPVVDGQKPVEIDTIQGMNIEVTNDFIEYLLKAMISGMGIPPEFLSYSEQTEFARSLGMMNGKFVRSIIVKQKTFAEQFSQLLRILYKNEYLNDFNLSEKKKKEAKKTVKDRNNNATIDTDEEKKELAEKEIRNKDALFDLSTIEVKFPSPQSLNMTALGEQIQNSNNVIEFITNTLVDENETELAKIVKKKITMDMLSSFEWSKYEKFVEESKLEVTEGNIVKASKEDTSDSVSGGDDMF